MSVPRQYDAIIIGAGIQGCSTALNLCLRKYRVLLLDKNLAGRGASGVNAGGVRRLFRAPPEIPLSMESMELWRDLEKQVGSDCGFKATGQMKIAENDTDMRKLEERASLMKALGYSHEELIDANELRRMVPLAAGHCVGALVSREDGYAEPYLTTRAILSAALKKGVDLRELTPVTALEQTGSIWRVQCTETFFEAPAVVNCAGAWGDRIARMVGDEVPLKPESPTMMVTARVPFFLNPVVGLASRKLSFKQMPNGTLVIGGGHRSRLDMQKERTVIDFKELRISSQTVTSLFPALKNVPVVRCWAGIEGMMPDQLPVISPSLKASGIFHAFGFSAHGFQLGPVVGRIMADLVHFGRSSLPLEPFRVDRFQGSHHLI
jgi:sarcosine oxidase subunit beta